jgi:hypothetical protein
LTGKLAFCVCLAAVLSSTPDLSRAQTGDTTINARYLLRSVWVDPNQPSGTGQHEFTITLKSAGAISENYEGGGKFKSSSSKTVVLGHDTESNVQYRVVNANTILRLRDTPTHTIAITIRVSGSACRLDFRATLKPGQKYFVAEAQRTGNWRNSEV